jgi:hypothetical protein
VGLEAEARHAVFLDYEAEGSSLVLRVRITRLTPELPIVYARTISSSSSTPALLRTPDHLLSAQAAHQQYMDALESRGIILLPLRLVVRSYQSSGNAPVNISPFVWLEGGAEIGLTQARAWTASLSLGYSWAPNLHDGWLAQARVSRLLTGKARSLTRPDVYLFFGLSGINVHGPDALLFSRTVPDVSDVVAATLGTRPQTTFVAVQMGLELRIRTRIGASVFLESLPALTDDPSLGDYFGPFGLIHFQTFGAELSFWF